MSEIVEIIGQPPVTVEVLEQPPVTVEIVETGGPPGPQGPTGEQGPPGPQGPAAAPGPGGTVVFTQGAPSATWTVAHNLAAYPSVTVVDTGGSEVIPTLHYVDGNTITLLFGSPTSGKAYLN